MVVEVPDGQFLWMEPRDLEFDSMSFKINDGSGRGLGSSWVALGSSLRIAPSACSPTTSTAIS